MLNYLLQLRQHLQAATLPHVCAAPKKRIVVLDVDETIGYFVELGIFCDALTQSAWNNDAAAQYAHFNHLMDAYPEFLRPSILDILQFFDSCSMRWYS